MHYLISFLLCLTLVGWVVRASSSGHAKSGEKPGGGRTKIGLCRFLGLGLAVASLVGLSVWVSMPAGSGVGDRAELVAPWPAPAPFAARLPVPAPATAPAPDVPRVRVKTGANVRTGPSRTAAVLRVAHEGDVLTRFGGANGWIRVGVTHPEGWVAESVAAPAS